MFVAASDQALMEELQQVLKQHCAFTLWDKSNNHNLSYLGLTLSVNNDCISMSISISISVSVSQTGFIQKLLTKYNISEQASKDTML